MRLRTKSMLVLVAVFLVLGSMIVGSVQLFTQQTVDREQEDVDETAELAAQQVDRSLENARRIVERIASDPPENLSDDPGPYLESVVDNYAFTVVTYVDTEGIIRGVRGVDEDSPLSRSDIVGTDNSEEAYFQNATERSTGYITEPALEDDGRVQFIVASRITRDGEELGVLAAVVTAYDPNLDAEARSATLNLFGSLSALNTSEQNARIVHTGPGGEEIVMAGAEEEFANNITSRSNSELTGWTVVVERDRSTLVDQLQQLQYIQFGSLFVVLVLVFGLGFYEYRTNLRQTGKLLDGFEELIKGNFAYSLTLTAAKEWEQISEGFNTMTDGLREREEELKDQQRELRERERRLSVLNRVLRHNLQNDMTVIQGHAQIIERAETDQRLDDAAAKIIEKSDHLVNHGKKARRLETVMENSSEGRSPVDVAERTTEIVRKYQDEYPEFTVHTSSPDHATVSAVSGVEFGIESLVENAFQHNDSDQPEVWVTVERLGEEIQIEIRDNGSGIPEHEREVLSNEEETSLEHGSGIGLWLAYWAVAKSNGDLSFGGADEQGGVVRVRLPVADTQEVSAVA